MTPAEERQVYWELGKALTSENLRLWGVNKDATTINPNTRSIWNRWTGDLYYYETERWPRWGWFRWPWPRREA